MLLGFLIEEKAIILINVTCTPTTSCKFQYLGGILPSVSKHSQFTFFSKYYPHLGGMRGSVLIKTFSNNNKLLGAIESKWDEVKRHIWSNSWKSKIENYKVLCSESGGRPEREVKRSRLGGWTSREMHAQNGTGCRHCSDGMVEVHKGRGGGAVA